MLKSKIYIYLLLLILVLFVPFIGTFHLSAWSKKVDSVFIKRKGKY